MLLCFLLILPKRLTYSWSFSGLNNTDGTFVADDVTGLLSSISGRVDSVMINGLLPKNGFVGNDNNFKDLTNGIAFTDVGGNKFNISIPLINYGTGNHGLTKLNLVGVYTGVRGNFTYAASAVPEPLTILGSITAAGFGVAFKRKKNSTKEE